MSLTLATLITGLLLLALGVLFLVPSPAVVTSLKRFPRSRTLAYVLFGVGAAWFLFRVWHLSAADFGQYRKQLAVFFALVAIGAFVWVPDFLAVRGACVLVLLGASNLLDAGYMNWQFGELTDGGRIYLYKVAVFAAAGVAIYLGASPFRARDFLDWLYRRPGRSRWVGLILASYGLVVSVVSFTY
ncbi:hypothetical protein [Synoicihabitans lomoniglobus]|uniref:Uncharacterized protein n=1 Tax=Synoicihabitans lomoniglobus TaxID=2909285 RepID=A0AAF0CHQ8_9BACT|nr:hypothetical protein [Opitutaceae bacterium LMO-M01]WED64577.1 hypothetical protein PXH66_19725 [Opitutaceae bacterium LMO-M01]